MSINNNFDFFEKIEKVRVEIGAKTNAKTLKKNDLAFFALFPPGLASRFAKVLK